MTEENNTPAEAAPAADATPQDQATPQEPEPSVSLKEAVEEGIKAAPKKAAEITQQLSQELTPEQLKQVEALAESKASRAVNEALSAEREKSKSTNFLTQDDVRAQVDEAIKLERQVAEAQRQLDLTLASIGAPVGSEAYTKVESVIAKSLESGAITHAALFDEGVLKAFAATVGVGVAPAAQEEEVITPFGGAHGGRAVSVNSDDGQINMRNIRQRMEEKMAEALRRQ